MPFQIRTVQWFKIASPVACASVNALMQAAVRVSLAKIGEGISTALIAWSGAPCCPDCVCTPVLTCPDFPSCPDCACQGSHRSPVAQEGVAPSYAIVGLLVASFISLVIGYLAGRLHVREAPDVTVGRPVTSEMGFRAVSGTRRPSLASKAPFGGFTGVIGDA